MIKTTVLTNGKFEEVRDAIVKALKPFGGTSYIFDKAEKEKTADEMLKEDNLKIFYDGPNLAGIEDTNGKFFKINIFKRRKNIAIVQDEDCVYINFKTIKAIAKYIEEQEQNDV